jgi:putative transposase
LILEAYRLEIIPLIEEAHDNGARYHMACEVVGISLRTLQRWKDGALQDQRKGSKKRVVRKLSPEMKEEIIEQCTAPRFRDLNPYEIVALLLNEGQYFASVRTFYRVLNERDMLHHRSNLRARSRHAKPPERIARASDQVYTWDITYMARTIKGLFFYAYVITDIFDKSIVGWAVHEEESGSHSRDLFDRTLQGKKVKLKALHADNGGPMKGITLMALLRELKVDVSHSRPRTSNDNPFIESLFKTMKYRVNYPGRFEDLSDARLWMAEFVYWYNTEHLHSTIGYVTPEQMRNGQAEAIFEQRNSTMRQAQIRYPERWGTRSVKHWNVLREVVLNPDKKE